MKVQSMGIGVDIESIQRFRDNLQEGFLKKIFTEKELDYCLSKSDPAPHLAARYAGKEAVVKALCLIGNNPDYKRIEILNDTNGIPYVKFDGFKILISMSHCNDKAIAFAMAEVNE